MIEKDDDKNEYSVYLRIKNNNSDEQNEYEGEFEGMLNSFCSFESQCGASFESLNDFDDGYELFSIDIPTFEEAVQIALKCANFWRVGVVELCVNKHSFCIKYAEPTIAGTIIPDLPLVSETYHLNKCNDKYVIYKIILFDISSINTQKEFMLVKTHEIKSKSTEKIMEEINFDGKQTGGRLCFPSCKQQEPMRSVGVINYDCDVHKYKYLKEIYKHLK